ncbi:MAG: hypothetical protein MZV63_37805 [Marinilabiliales bacterium]|nr:hypothetical protein [Marinilabiliales bacterium]
MIYSSRLKIAISHQDQQQEDTWRGLLRYIDESERITDITVAIDKLEKIGIEAVNEELRGKGIAAEAVSKLQPIIELKGTYCRKAYRTREDSLRIGDWQEGY